jgi:hypothetical protein
VSYFLDVKGENVSIKYHETDKGNKMGKQKHKAHKSHLAPADKQLGRQHVYILIGMIIIGIAIGLYRLN